MASRFFSRSLKNASTLISSSNQASRCVSSRSLVHQLKQQSMFATVNGGVNSRAFSASAISFQQKTNTFSELSSFLAEEIKLENEAHKQKAAAKITGFDVKTDGPNVTLTKAFQNETITVKFNINGSIDSNEDAQIDEAIESLKSEKEEETQMKARPTFTVDIKRPDHDQVLSFGCSFLPNEEAGDKDVAAVEDFQIDELSIHKGEWDENVYTADCSVLDGQLYDILLNLLDERGVGEVFANELVEFATTYEHSQYISLLKNLKDFTK